MRAAARSAAIVPASSLGHLVASSFAGASSGRFPGGTYPDDSTGSIAHRSPSPSPRNSSSIPAVIMPEGRATTATPMSEEIMAMVRPTSEEG